MKFCYNQVTRFSAVSIYVIGETEAVQILLRINSRRTVYVYVIASEKSHQKIFIKFHMKYCIQTIFGYDCRISFSQLRQIRAK